MHAGLRWHIPRTCKARQGWFTLNLLADHGVWPAKRGKFPGRRIRQSFRAALQRSNGSCSPRAPVAATLQRSTPG